MNPGNLELHVQRAQRVQQHVVRSTLRVQRRRPLSELALYMQLKLHAVRYPFTNLQTIFLPYSA
jgi:hypothetical protein